MDPGQVARKDILKKLKNVTKFCLIGCISFVFSQISQAAESYAEAQDYLM